jgi:gluconokinase
VNALQNPDQKMSSMLDEFVEEVEPSFDVVSVMAGVKPAVLLSLDVGTSGVRAALFDELGNEIEGAQVSSQRNFAAVVDFAELDAEAIVEQVADTVDDLLATSFPSTGRIEFIAISCFWHSLIGVDSAGRPTTPLLTWADTRGAQMAKNLRAEFDEVEIHARTGCRFHPSYWPAKLQWLQTERFDTFKNTRLWLGFSEYLSLRLFGETATSISMASATGLFNQRSRDWDWDFIRELKIRAETLPEISGSSIHPRLARRFASRWPALAEAHLCGVIGDGAANNIGGGCSTPDRIALMIGTSGAMRVVYEGEPPQQLPPELWCYRADRSRVVVGGALSDGGGLYRWLTGSLFLEDDPAVIANQLSEMEPDSHGLTVLPFWSGERSTGWSADARGAILGLSQQTRPIDIVRAALESISYRFALIAQSLETVAPGAAVIATGNALRSSPVWVQIMADVLGRQLNLGRLAEASLRGAALLALEAVGKIGSIEEVIVPVDAVFDPDMAKHARYQQGLRRQQEIYERLLGTG